MYVLHAKGIYDSGSRTLDATGMAVEGNRILWIGMYDKIPQPIYDKATFLDLSDFYLLPGLVNTHVHLEFDSTPTARIHYIGQSQSVRLARALAQAQMMMLSGVTTVRDAGSSWELLEITDPSLTSLYRLPRFQLSGPPITVTGGHLNFMHVEADTPDEIRKSVREHHKRGCTSIKMMVTGGQMTPGSGPDRESYSTEEISVLVRESHHLKLPTIAHCLTTRGFVNCMEAGIDSIEHCACFVRNQENLLLERIYETDVMQHYQNDHRFFMNGLSASYHTFDAVRDGIKKPDEREKFLLMQEDRMFSIFSKLVDLGLLPVVGTDAGVSNTFFDETYRELELMCERGGLSEAQAIEAGTINGAACLGLQDSIGRLAEGFLADIIALVGNPLEDIHAFREVPWIMRDGEIVKGSDI